MGQGQVESILQLWRVARSVSVSSEEERRMRFASALKALGWTYRSDGSFKHALVRDGLIVKFDRVGDDDCHTRSEWRIWRRASVYKKGFLAPCYAYEDGLLIQQYQANRCRRKEHCAIARWYSWRFRILDWSVNHSHRPSGNPIFFDYDAKGCDARHGRKRPALIPLAA